MLRLPTAELILPGSHTRLRGDEPLELSTPRSAQKFIPTRVLGPCWLPSFLARPSCLVSMLGGHLMLFQRGLLYPQSQLSSINATSTVALSQAASRSHPLRMPPPSLPHPLSHPHSAPHLSPWLSSSLSLFQNQSSLRPFPPLHTFLSSVDPLPLGSFYMYFSPQHPQNLAGLQVAA